MNSCVSIRVYRMTDIEIDKNRLFVESRLIDYTEVSIYNEKIEYAQGLTIN